MKNKKFKSLLWLIPLATLAAALFFLKPRAKADSGGEVVTEQRSATVTLGSLESSLISGGSLSESSSSSLSYPGDVRLLQWEVSENEVVAQGQILATVDKNSVLAAVSRLSELMDKLDSTLEKSRSDKLSSTVTAPMAGRIVAVFATPGDDVARCIEENGALMLLSLDGRLSVSIPAGTLSAGDSVVMKRADGSVLGASVSEIVEDSAIVTVSDALTVYDEIVSVFDENDRLLGSGSLGVHRPMAITLFGGTVQSVSVMVGASVYAGQALLTLSDTDYTGTYDSLLLKRRKLEAQIDALYALYNAGALTAPATGYVSELNTAAVGLSDGREQTGGKSGFTFPMSFDRSKRTNLSLLSDLVPEEEISEDEQPETYFLAGIVESVDKESAAVNLKLLDGTPFALNGLELLANCPDVKIDSIVPTALLLLEYKTEDDSLVKCTVYTLSTGERGKDRGITVYPGGSTAAKEETYIAEETALCTFTAFDKVDIVLTVDELDISRLSVGQQAAVTLDALPAELYTAAITKIDPNGVNSGGNTKYSVTVTMDRDEDMLSGMNASVRIPLGIHDDLLLLRAEALQEDEGGTFVYTSYNEKEGYSGRRAVTTGLSDGGMAEIVSGLAEGDTVYYPFAESMEYTFTK